MSMAIPVGSSALIAEVDEYAVEVVDGEMAALGGTVTRRPAEEVLAELEAAEQAARASEKEARRVMREAKKAERAEKREQSKEKWDERLSALKDKLTTSRPDGGLAPNRPHAQRTVTRQRGSTFSVEPLEAYGGKEERGWLLPFPRSSLMDRCQVRQGVLPDSTSLLPSRRAPSPR